MKRKTYESPTTKLVLLQQHCQLLQTSGEVPAMPDYPDGGDPFNPVP